MKSRRMTKMLNGEIAYKNICTNSKDVKKGNIFVAIKGARFDGHDFVGEAFKRGAVAAVVEDKNLKYGALNKDQKIIVVDDTKYELSRLASLFYGNPSRKLKVIGITGTNGKTTTAFLLDKIFTDAGVKTGVVGTIYYKVDGAAVPADRTTPDALRLNKFLSDMVSSGTACAILEVSSHALQQDRTGHIFYDEAVFTNLTPEHLDFHKEMDSYFEAKAKIFDNLKSHGSAFLNVDDPRSKDLIKRIDKKIYTYGISAKSDIQAFGIKKNITGSEASIVTPWGDLRIRTGLLGSHNISNILAAVAVSGASGLDIKKAEESVNNFQGVPGRLQLVNNGQDFFVFIDYAHTEDALYKVLMNFKEFAEKRIITVFGCGGDRDKSKRPLMGKVSSELSEYTIVTSDNPRSESPAEIAREVEKGISAEKRNYRIILDREKAVRAAIKMAEKGDIVLIAGKGHEVEQIIGNKRLRFNDYEVAADELKRRFKSS